MTWYGPNAPGRRPKYLSRALTPAERKRISRQRAKGAVIPEADPLATLRAAHSMYTIAARTGTDDALRQATAQLVIQVAILLGEY